MVEGTAVVADEEQEHAPLLQQDFLATEVHANATQANDLQQFLSHMGDGAETVLQPLTIGIELTVVTHMVQLTIEQHALGIAGHILIGEVHLQVGLEGAVGNEGESLSKTLEYMLADWAAAQAGKAVLKSHSDNSELAQQVEYLEKRSHGYPQLYDKRVGFMRGKNSDGSFESLDGFNPQHQTRAFTEGNAWQYLWLVPHDVEGLMQMLGGRDIALKRLDSLFVADSQLNEEAQPDISGLIGQYAHGNEPSHHIVYLYALMGQPRKTAKLVRQIQRELYTDQPAGLCGNEDVGQMSAWYVLSALGFYQVEPCGGRYVIGSPLVKDATLHVGNGKTFAIHVHGASEKAIYIKKALLNGKPLGNPKQALILRHEDIVKGGTFDIYMTK